jgi:hypothetical protein
VPHPVAFFAKEWEAKLHALKSIDQKKLRREAGNKKSHAQQ